MRICDWVCSVNDLKGGMLYVHKVKRDSQEGDQTPTPMGHYHSSNHPLARVQKGLMGRSFQDRLC